MSNTSTTYPKAGVEGSKVLGVNARLDACAAAMDELHRRADCLEGDLGPDNTLTTPNTEGRADATEEREKRELLSRLIRSLGEDQRSRLQRMSLRELRNELRELQSMSGGSHHDSALRTADATESERAHGALSEREEEVANPHVEARENKPASIFLRPSDRKYPVKVKRNGEWEYDRGLLVAAEREANMHHDEALASRAKSILEREFGRSDGRRDTAMTDAKLKQVVREIEDAAKAGRANPYKDKVLESDNSQVDADKVYSRARRDATARTDPPVSEKQRRFMRYAEEHPKAAGVSNSVAKEFNEADPGGKLPERK